MPDPHQMQNRHSGAALPRQIHFNRQELDAILSVYGRLVAKGECRDYAIGSFSDHAVFYMHHRSSEAPTWIVEKRPELARRQGAYSVTNASGHILKRGHEIDRVLAVLDKDRFRTVE